jgi:hypothetical protein
MKKASLFFFFFCLSSFLFSQEAMLLPFKMAFKWAPFGITDVFSGPNMKVGFDYHIYKSVYGGIDGGAIIIPYPPYFKKNYGFFARKEIKFFRIDEDSYRKGVFYYWGFEAMYKYQQFDRSDSIAIPNKDKYLKDYTMYKNSVVLHIKTGGVLYFIKEQEQPRLSKEMPKFFMEFFAGIGVRQTSGYCAGLTGKEADAREYQKENVSLIFNMRNGFNIYPSFVMSVKFGWRMI